MVRGGITKMSKLFVLLLAITMVISIGIPAFAANEAPPRQTAGRDVLGEFAPKFAALNDDVLFGEVWSRTSELSLRDRSMVTVTALISGGNFEQLAFHLNRGKQNGLTRTEISEVITHLAFYVGWPKAWSAFNLAREIFVEDSQTPLPNSVIFPKGELITNDFFIGDTYLHMMILPESPHNTAVGNVTFSPGARNNWHTHDLGQFLFVTGGVGYYQEEGKPARRLNTGDVVNIPANVKHWHGAAPDNWFAHIAVTPGETQWLEALNDDTYNEAIAGSEIVTPRQTAGRNSLGEFAPKFAEVNDDVLFGEIWSRELELSPRDRSMVTVTALISGGNFEQLAFHLNRGKQNGITKTEISEVITHLAFYVGWPKAWSAFNLAREIFVVDIAQSPLSNSAIFPKGELITNDFFIGDTYLHMIILPEASHNTAVGNVTFSPGARNNWHTHDVGQFLLVTGGVGYYQEEGKPARLLRIGDVVNISANVKHWHGAALGDWFVHIAVTPGETQWFEALTDDEYKDAITAATNGN
jgi:alkylhydroperoxidase/carboxymuconolactone decarboxylase family protein YurZ/quercetin dioxygenase-like cupin family protein